MRREKALLQLRCSSRRFSSFSFSHPQTRLVSLLLPVRAASASCQILLLEANHPDTATRCTSLLSNDIEQEPRRQVLTVYVRIGRRMCTFGSDEGCVCSTQESTGAPFVYTSHHLERHAYVVHPHTKVLRLLLSNSMSSSEQSSNSQIPLPFSTIVFHL